MSVRNLFVRVLPSLSFTGFCSSIHRAYSQTLRPNVVFNSLASLLGHYKPFDQRRTSSADDPSTMAILRRPLGDNSVEGRCLEKKDGREGTIRGDTGWLLFSTWEGSRNWLRSAMIVARGSLL